MITRLGLLVLTLLCFPLSALASKINIEYTGHISSIDGDGLGYSVNDLVSGSVAIDLSKAEGKYSDTPTLLWAYANASTGLVTSSNYAGADTGGLLDFVQIYDHQFNSPSYYDGLSLDEILSVQGSIMESFGLYFNYDADWIAGVSGAGLNFSSSDADVLKNSGGGFSRWNIDNWSTLGIARFQLDSIKISSTDVPEPSSAILLLVGLLGLALRRK